MKTVKYGKSLLFLSRAAALVIGLGLWHALKYVEDGKTVELVEASALIWLGIGDIYFSFEHYAQDKFVEKFKMDFMELEKQNQMCGETCGGNHE